MKTQARRATEAVLERMMSELPFPVAISRSPPGKSGFPAMAGMLSWGAATVVFHPIRAVIERSEIAYDADHKHSLEIFAHEIGHVFVYRAEPEYLHLLGANERSKMLTFVKRKVEEAAWDVAEGLLRRVQGRQFDRKRFMKVRDDCLATYAVR